MPRGRDHLITTADMLQAGVCFEDVWGGLQISEGRTVSTYDQAEADMIEFLKVNGREAELRSGRDWFRRTFDEDVPTGKPKVPFSARSRKGNGAGDGSYHGGGFGGFENPFWASGYGRA